MSSTNFATVQWGGRVIENKHGHDYEGGQCTMFYFGNISTFDELRATIARELNVAEYRCIQRLMYRLPVAIPGRITYRIMDVCNDTAVDKIRQFADQCHSGGFLQFFAIINEHQPIHYSTGEEEVNVANRYVEYDDNDDNDSDDDSDEDDDFWMDTDDSDEEDDESENTEDDYETHWSNPILPLVHPPPYSDIDFELMRDDTRAKPSRMLFDASKEFAVGMLFPSRDAVQLAAKEYSLRRNHHFRSDETKKAKYMIKCGNPNGPCGWRLRAIRQSTMLWKITKYTGPHTCNNPQMSRDHRQLDQKYLCTQIEAMVTAQPDIKIKPLMAEIKDKLGFEPTYRKTWAAKQMAIANAFGGWDASYGQLRKYMNEMQLKNPGSHVVIDDYMNVDGSCKIFHRMFWTLKQTIEGFKSCRPVIFVDGTFLYGKYRGMLLCACSLDSNNHIFPLAFVVVDAENVDNWIWFMTSLRRYVTSRDNICVISDRHIGIKRAMETEGWRPPHGHHRYCIRHIVSNYNKRFKNAEGKQLIQMAGKLLY